MPEYQHPQDNPGLAGRFQRVDDLNELAALQDDVADEPLQVFAGRYEVLRTLGQGGMGAVYAARDTRLHRTVAIKTILPQFVSYPDASRRFFREAEALARLNHPNILTLYDSGQDGDLHFLVMELGGRDLGRLLQRQDGGLPVAEALPVLLAVARALDYAHRQGIVHRDLKPANILIGRADELQARPVGPGTAVKVMDFGLAKVEGASALTVPATKLGTPQYMAPEQVLGREADARADLYALGVVGYEVLTGVRPFDGDDVPAIFAQHLNLAPVPPSAFRPELPQALEVLILRLLEKDPVRRPPSAQDVVRTLEGLVSLSPMADASAAPAQGAASGAPTQTVPAPISQFPLGRLPARTALVGRAEELAFLQAQYEAVAAGGGGRLLLLSGEPGVGKTRLVQELGVYARQRGGAFLEGHYLREGDVPYASWIDLLRAGLRGLPADAVRQAAGPFGADLAAILPELVDQIGPFPERPRLAPEAQQRRLYDGVSALLTNLSQARPLVLLLDDLQWAPGLTVLSHVVRSLGEERVLLVGAYRDQEFRERADLVREQAEFNRARLVTPLALRLLTEEQTAQMVAHTFGPGAAAALGERVYRVTRGNAFFVEEVLRSLAESGAVRPGEQGWEVVDASQVGIPESVKLVVEERVARLGEEVRQVLVQAAVLGQEFALGALQALTGLEEEGLAEQVERAVAARLLVDRTRRAEDRYAFADDQVQEVLYEGMTLGRRRRLHLRAGQALETLYGSKPNEHLEELARHFVAGNDPEKGADYSYRAGRKADRLFVWSRSIPLYKTALELWEELGGHVLEQAQAYEQLGDACWKSGIEAHKGIEYFERALALYGELGDRRKQATLYSQIGREYGWGSNMTIRSMSKAEDHLHQARAILEELPESQSLGLVYLTISAAYHASLRRAECQVWVEKAVELARRIDAPAVLAQSLSNQAVNLLIRGSAQNWLEIKEEGWRLSLEHRLAYATDENRGTSIWMNCLLRNPRRGLEWAERGHDMGTNSSLLGRPSNFARCYALLGQLDEAERHTRVLQGRMRELGEPLYRANAQVTGLVWLRRGSWEEARDVLERGFEWQMAAQNAIQSVEAVTVLGRLYLATGRVDTAEERLAWALDRCRSGDAVLYSLNILPALVEVCVEQGRLGQGEAYLQEAQGLLDRPFDWCGLPGETFLAEGRLRAAQGRWGEAEAAFQRSVEVCQKYELRWDEAKVYYEWGCCLATAVGAVLRDRPGVGAGEDRHEPRPRELLTKAAAMWDEMGAGPWADRCRAKLAELD